MDEELFCDYCHNSVDESYWVVNKQGEIYHLDCFQQIQRYNDIFEDNE